MMGRERSLCLLEPSPKSFSTVVVLKIRGRGRGAYVANGPVSLLQADVFNVMAKPRVFTIPVFKPGPRSFLHNSEARVPITGNSHSGLVLCLFRASAATFRYSCKVQAK